MAVADRLVRTDVVTIGETLAVLSGQATGPFRPMASLYLSSAGAESNVAIGLSRLGHRASWIGRLGDDELGRVVLAQLRAEGIDVRSARVDAETQTSLLLKERRTADLTRVIYYRRGLAGSRLCPADVDEEVIRGARVLHVTGITPALSPQAHAAVLKAVEVAQAAGVTISLDVNYRATLWSAAGASTCLSPLAEMADLVFASAGELALLDASAVEDPLTAAKTLAGLRRGRQVVVKQGSRGAFAVVDGAVERHAGLVVRAVDPVGAGDAFVAGYLSALIEDLPPAERLRRGCVAGAFVVATDGDWEGFPRRSELDLLALGEEATLR